MSIKWKIAQAAEVRWWSNYLKNKDKEIYYSWKKSYWTNFLEDLEFTLPDKKATVLDAGCGPAGIFTILHDHDVVAVDPLLSKYEDTIVQFDPSNYPNTTFINSSLEQMPLNKTYDVIFCLNAINHVSSIPSCLNNMFKVLKPGGHMILSTDAHNSDVVKNIFQWVPGDILHPHQYNLDEYINYVNNAGFQIKRSKKMKSEKIFSYWVIVAQRPF